eukprot:TRINITY_DN13093_c0_g1_i1.p1 TRINITY_DN13093_c0_g1~~TRINITY_DN13093_c0_g1_i1.p1  ORF type:complete len:675 (+),score=159.41 TRINITY_DN13093_c0_g1_i1:188-2212(+)
MTAHKTLSHSSPHVQTVLQNASNHPDESSTPLHKAAKEGLTEKVFDLLKSGADLNAKDQFGSTPLHLSSFWGKKDCVQILVNSPGIELDCTDVFNRTPLFYAGRNGHCDILRLLIARGADINIKTDNGETALMKATVYGHMECVKFICEHPAVRLEDGDSTNGNTPLHIAASRGDISCIQFLLQKGAVINAQNLSGETPLHLSVMGHHKACLDYLLDVGADPAIETRDHQTALQMAMLQAKAPVLTLKEKEKIDEIIAILKDQASHKHISELKKIPLPKWTAKQLAEWVALIGFPEYKENFLKNQICGKNLTSLSVSSLKKELEIGPYGHRTTLVKEISKMVKEFKEKKIEERRQVVEKQKQLLVQTLNPTYPSKGEEMSVIGDIWKISWIDLEIHEMLGKGFFGEVRRATWKGTDVAVKIIYREAFNNHSDINIFYKEVSIISKLRHPNVLMFLGACMQDGNRCLVTEYLVGGSLSNLIHHSFITLEKAPNIRSRIIGDILKGMTYLHHLHILHRDLTPKNLLLDSNMNCKVADFGLSRVREESGEMTTSMGCLPYQAPEVFRGEQYSESADVFSFGIVLYELISGSEPHKGVQALKFANMVAYEGYRPTVPAGNRWESTITQCLQEEPASRPSFKELLDQYQLPERMSPPVPLSKYDEALAKPSVDYGGYAE